MQGSVLSSLKCSVSVDTLGRELLSSEEGFGVFRNKGIVDIPTLAFCNDILSVGKCGVNSLEFNTAVNAKIESKKFTLGKDKCVKLHINKRGVKNPDKCETRSTIKVHDSPIKEDIQIIILKFCILYPYFDIVSLVMVNHC